MAKTDVGKTILYSLIVGFPTAIIAGPIFGTFVARHVSVEMTGGIAAQLAPGTERESLASV